MKTLLALSVVILFNAFSFATQTEWKLLKSENGVQVFYKKAECNLNSDPAYMDPDQELVLIKIVNNNTKNVTVSWKFDIWFGQNCRSCSMGLDSSNPYYHSFDLAPGQVIEGNCQSHQKTGLMLFSSFYKKDASKNNPMTRFELNGFSVKIK